MSDQWQERIRPVCLQRRYEFPNYDSLRKFLDSAAQISEREGVFPDMGFGRDYVNVTINADEKTNELGELERRLAIAYDELFIAGTQA